MAKTPARKQRRTVGRKEHPRPSKEDVVTFHGLALVRGARKGIETLIISDLEAAKAFDLTADELKLANHVLKQAAGGRKCKGQSQNGQVRCINLGCAHKCHLWKFKLPLPADSPPAGEDMGENDREWVDKEKGCGYICGCDGWEDS